MKFIAIAVFWGCLLCSYSLRAEETIPAPIIRQFIEFFVYGEESTTYNEIRIRRWNKPIKLKMIVYWDSDLGLDGLKNIPEDLIYKIEEIRSISDQIENFKVLSSVDGFDVSANFFVLVKNNIVDSLERKQWDGIRDLVGVSGMADIDDQLSIGEKCFSVVLTSKRGYEQALIGVDTSLESKILADCLSRHFLSVLGFYRVVGHSNVAGINSVLNPDYGKLAFSEIDVLALKFVYEDRSGKYGKVLREAER